MFKNSETSRRFSHQKETLFSNNLKGFGNKMSSIYDKANQDEDKFKTIYGFNNKGRIPGYNFKKHKENRSISPNQQKLVESSHHAFNMNLNSDKESGHANNNVILSKKSDKEGIIPPYRCIYLLLACQ